MQHVISRFPKTKIEAMDIFAGLFGYETVGKKFNYR
jgi:hypothetical protein